MIYCFIDTNILLDFYRYSSGDLSQLEKFSDILKKNNQITLYIPSQLESELWRNRESTILQANNSFTQNFNNKVAVPSHWSTTGNYASEFIDIQKQLQKLKSNWEKDVKTRTSNLELAPDNVIKNLFSAGTKINSKDYYEEAKCEFELGNAPGKNGSLGDAINFISLAKTLPKNEDLYLITRDNDYKSEFCLSDNLVVKENIRREWASRCGDSKIILYSSLKEFFDAQLKDIQLSQDSEQNGLISLLEQSRSFATTHNLIGKLNTFSSFSDDQIISLFKCYKLNNQIYSIRDDTDIASFFERLKNSYQGGTMSIDEITSGILEEEKYN